MLSSQELLDWGCGYTGAVVKVHVDSKTQLIWYADDELRSVRSVSLPPASFAGWLSGPTVAKVKLLGVRSNAELLVHLYSQQQSGCLTVSVGSPGVCSRNELQTPKTALQKMNQLSCRRPSCGGWHVMTEHDYAIYNLLAAADTLTTPDDAAALLSKHPANAALTFIPTVDLVAAAKLLAQIVDPRWFIDIDYPDRLSSLRAFLGLTNSNMQSYLQGGRGGINQARAHLLVRAWLGDNVPDFDTAKASPADFLRRAYSETQAAGDGLYKASCVFVTFLRNAWIASVSGHPEWNTNLFEKDWADFRESASKAYEQHRRQLSSTDG